MGVFPNELGGGHLSQIAVPFQPLLESDSFHKEHFFIRPGLGESVIFNSNYSTTLVWWNYIQSDQCSTKITMVSANKEKIPKLSAKEVVWDSLSKVVAKT